MPVAVGMPVIAPVVGLIARPAGNAGADQRVRRRFRPLPTMVALGTAVNAFPAAAKWSRSRAAPGS